MLKFSNCKINIGLNIYNKLPNGYHNIESIFYPVMLFDTIEIIPNNSGNINYTGYGLSINSPIENNLIVKAYKSLQQKFNVGGADIYVLKNIPMGAGLGGGSANAAYTLMLCNKIYNLQLDTTQLIQLAAELGSDCAFFILNKPAYTFGIGNLLKPINLDLSAYKIVILKTDVHISTSEAYANANKRGLKNDATNITEYLNQPIEKWHNYFTNDFENYVFHKFPEVAKLKEYLYKQGALYASMSGSGSAVFGIFNKNTSIDLNINNCFAFTDEQSLF